MSTSSAEFTDYSKFEKTKSQVKDVMNTAEEAKNKVNSDVDRIQQ